MRIYPVLMCLPTFTEGIIGYVDKIPIINEKEKFDQLSGHS